MAACVPDLTNVSMLSPLGFKLGINAQEFKYLEYFCTSVTFPAIALPAAETKYTNMYAPLAGDSLRYDPLSVSFILDEDMKNYLEIYNWLYKNSKESIVYRDLTLSILTNQNNPNIIVQYMGAAPTGLSSFEFNTQNTDIQYLTCTVDFAYTSFKFVVT